MISPDHTFYSDPHIGDPNRWIESGEDPMLKHEAEGFVHARRTRERIQLLFGSFLLLAIVTIATPAMHKPARLLSQAAIFEVGERTPAIPLPAFPPPDLSAHAYAVRLIGTDVWLMHQREWKELAPASLTKILTAALALEHLPQNERIIFSKDAKLVGEKMSKASVGEVFLRDDVLKMTLIESANDAAYAIAEAIEKQKTGNNPEEHFPEYLSLVEQSLEKIGATHTRFLNPTGLDQEGHYTSVEDLTKIVEHVWAHHPEIWDITKSPDTHVVSERGKIYSIESTNELLKEFPALQGGKTGLTENAKGALILLYPVPPSFTAVIVILGSENRFEDGRTIIRWLEDAF